MSTYFLVDIIILFVTGLWESICRLVGYKRQDTSKSVIYLIVVLGILTLFIGLRSYSTGDSANYKYAWDQTISAVSIIDAFKDVSGEYGYIILMYVLGKFTDNVSVFFCINALITILACFKALKRNSPIMWLSVLMLACVSPLYNSMVVMRNILAVALYFVAMQYVIKQEFMHYCVSVLLISMIHTSAVVMIPLYFILNIEWNIKKEQIGIIVCALVLIASAMSFYLNGIVKLAAKMFHQYDNYSYGMDFGLSVTSLFKVVSIQLFILWNYKKLNIRIHAERCFFNASILYSIFYIFASGIYILQRFAYYFAVSHMVLVPIIIYRTRNAKKRKKMTFFMVSFLILYAFLANYSTDYMWCWE